MCPVEGIDKHLLYPCKMLTPPPQPPSVILSILAPTPPSLSVPSRAPSPKQFSTQGISRCPSIYTHHSEPLTTPPPVRCHGAWPGPCSLSKPSPTSNTQAQIQAQDSEVTLFLCS